MFKTPILMLKMKFFWLIFRGKFEQKTQKSIFSQESVKTKEHKESNGCEKYYCWRYALYKINFWTILKKLLQKNDFRRFPLFEIFAQIVIVVGKVCPCSFSGFYLQVGLHSVPLSTAVHETSVWNRWDVHVHKVATKNCWREC